MRLWISTHVPVGLGQRVDCDTHKHLGVLWFCGLLQTFTQPSHAKLATSGSKRIELRFFAGSGKVVGPDAGKRMASSR